MNFGLREAVFGGLFATMMAGASVFWHLHARPEAVLRWFRGTDAAPEDRGLVLALEVAVGALLFVLAALAGAVAVGWR